MKIFGSDDQPTKGTTLEQQVADWLALRDRGMSTQEELALRRWLDEDSSRARMYREMESMWDLFDRVQELPEANLPPDPTVLAPKPRPLIRANFRWICTAAAAAAVCAISYLQWWQPNYYARTTETRIGDIRKRNLPDGSVVDMNTDTLLSVSFSPNERRLRLERGEAHFAVAKNPNRPFIVEAQGISIRAVGTAFGVRIDPNAIQVLVSAGTVQVMESEVTPRASAVQTAHAPFLANAGEKVTFPTTITQQTPADPPPEAVRPRVVRLASDEIKRQLAWHERKLQFEEAPLAAIAAEFNRYNRQKLVIVDEQLAAAKFGGTFRPDDPESFVRMLQSNFGVIADHQSDKTLLRSSH